MFQSNMPNSDKQIITPLKISNQILSWIIASLFVVPFLWYRRSLPLPSFYGEWAAIFLGLLALFIWLTEQKDRFLIPSLAFLPIGLALLINMQLIVMPDLISSYDARLSMFYLLFSAALMTTIFNIKPLINIKTVTAAALLIGTLLNCGHDWYRIIFDDAKVLGGLGQKNNYADYLMLGIISLCYLHAQKRFGILVFLLLLPPLIINSAELSQRSTWIYFIALIGFTLIKAYKAKHQNKLLTHSVLLASALFVLAAVTLPTQSSLARLMASGEAELGAQSRLWIWKSAWQMILEHPWRGVGFGNFDWTYFATKSNYAAGAYWGWVEHAHNIVLHLFAELGILAPLILLLGLTIWLKTQSDQPFDNDNWWLWSCIGIIGVHSLLEYPLWYAYFLAPFAVLLGLTAQSGVEVRLPNSFRWLGCLMICAAGLAGANFLANYLQLETFIIHLTANERSVDPADLDTIAHREPMLRTHVWKIKAASAQITSTNAEEWLPFLRQVNHATPYPDFVLKQIVALKLTGNMLEAIELSKILAHAFPKRAAGYLADPDTRNALGKETVAAMHNALQQH